MPHSAPEALLLFLALAFGALAATPPPAPPASTLRWFEPAEAEKCAWVEARPDLSSRRTLATLPIPCDELRSMSVADPSRAAVSFGDRPVLLTAAGGVVTASALPTPPTGELWDLGFDAAGVPLAFTLGGGVPGEGVIAYEGATYPTDGIHDGVPVLAHAFAWRGGAWVREETVLTSTGWDYAPGPAALQAHLRLVGRQGYRRRTGFLDHGYTGVGAPSGETVDAALTVALDAAGAVTTQAGEDEWRVATAGGRRIAWWNRSAEGLLANSPVLAEQDGRWVEVAASTTQAGLEPTRLQCDGRVLLVQVYAWPALVRVLADGRTTELPTNVLAPVLWPLPD